MIFKVGLKLVVVVFHLLYEHYFIIIFIVLNYYYYFFNFKIKSITPETRKEGNVLFNDALNTFYLRLYGVRHMVKDHSDSEKGNPLS